MIYRITEAQKKSVFPNLHENTRGFLQGEFFLRMGIWTLHSA